MVDRPRDTSRVMVALPKAMDPLRSMVEAATTSSRATLLSNNNAVVVAVVERAVRVVLVALLFFVVRCAATQLRECKWGRDTPIRAAAKSLASISSELTVDLAHLNRLVLSFVLILCTIYS